MTYIDRLNQFNRWLESNPLPGNSQLLFFKLLDVFNRAGWPEFVRVDTLTLMRMCDTMDKRTAYKARDRLVSSGLLEYRKGSKRNPSAYKLSDNFATVSATLCATTSATVSATVSCAKDVPLNKTKSKTKTEEETAREDFSFMYDKNLAQVVQHFESTIGYIIPRPAVSAVMEWLKTMPADLICAAIDEAALANARDKWKYATACLRAWNAKGIRTLDALKAAQAAEVARQQQPRRKTAQDEFLAIARGEIP